VVAAAAALATTTGSVVARGASLSGWGGSAALAGQRVSSASLAPYVVRAGEEPGYSSTFTSTSFVTSAAELYGRHDGVRLRREGFRGALVKATCGPRKLCDRNLGVSSVIALGSPAAAKSEQHSELKEFTADGTVTRFTIKRIPISAGFIDRGRHVASVLWVEGSCVLYVGAVSYYAVRRSSIVAGALKIYARTAHSGVCS
jgi:hypothetical protein